ncbi:MAG: PKD domain-containing protein [Euryarchaeota archaeon]|nr:PKD domain-containing protein [Euryarchaeota archaeon]MDE1836184.1 PKD domain-containing protein [Euryarchaeota archaeon]MDE1881641.1 PKD domain-containing protein [Euryarchaeota archaeon]MDE2045453.1 PKD domain-containing protein [Thermoplasmata archaeon]
MRSPARGPWAYLGPVSVLALVLLLAAPSAVPALFAGIGHLSPPAAGAPLSLSVPSLKGSTSNPHPLPQTGSPTWIDLTARAGKAPTARAYSSMTWDSGDSYAVLFGGENGGTSADGDTWTYSTSGGWNQVCSSCSPAGRAEPALAYDSADSRVVMFGGCTGINLASDTCNMGDSWTYAQGTWTQVSGTLPTSVLAGGMSDDPADSEAVLFGGCTLFNIDILNPSNSACGSTDYSQQTAVYTAAGGWKVLSPSTSPSVREAQGMAFDPATNEVILFGGYNGNNVLGDTWAFKGGQWFQLNPTTSPPALANGVMFWDSATHTIILTQGNQAGGDLGSTYSFSGGNWTQLYPTTNPTPRDGTMAAAPPGGGLPIMYGGSTNSSDVADTWALGTTLTASVSATPTATDVGQVVTFSSTISGGQTPYAIGWRFGDGGTATTANASHTYSSPSAGYTATMNVTDSYGQSVSQTVSPQVDISALPAVTVAASPAIGGTGNVTSFWANETGGTAPVTYAWTFGDGGTSTTPDPTHVYAGAGSYSAKVTVVDGVNIVASANTTVQVKAPKGSVAVAFTASSTSGTAPLNVSFTSNVAGGAPPYTLSWKFGDGGTSGAPSPSHTYVVGGVFPVTLTATDTAGHTGNYTVPITVRAGPMSLSVSAASTAGDAPFTTTFSENLTGGQSPFNYSWNFGDGSPLVYAPTPTHTYTGNGTFMVTFRVLDAPADGQTRSKSLNLTVWPSLVVNKPRVPGSPGVGATAGYGVTVSGGDPPYAFTWDFGDGSAVVPTTTNTTTHAYRAGATYTVTVWVLDHFQTNVSSNQSVIVGGQTGRVGAGGGSITFSVSIFSGPDSVAYLLLPIVTILLLAGAVYLATEGGRRGLVSPPPRQLPARCYAEPSYYPGNGWK